MKESLILIKPGRESRGGGVFTHARPAADLRIKKKGVGVFIMEKRKSWRKDVTPGVGRMID